MESCDDDKAPQTIFQTVLMTNYSHGVQNVDSQKLANEKIIQQNFWKNMGVISVGFLLFFTGYYPVNAVQSSLNNEKGLGMAALSAKYASEAFGNLITNNYMVHRLGCKWSISVGMFMYATYIAANFYPVWATLLPCGVITGIGAATMWMAQGLYLTKYCNAIIELRWPQLSVQERAERLAKLKYIVFGIFNFFYFASNAVGNMASSLILPLVNNNSDANATLRRLELCGADYCNEDIGSAPVAQDKMHVYGLSIFCLSSAIVGLLLITVLVDRLPKLGISEKTPGDKTILERVVATIKHWRYPYQLLLIPLGLYSGLNGPFWTAEFTKSFVTCTVGVHYIGFVMVCYGVTAPLSICLFTYISKKSYRYVSYFVGLMAHISVLVTMLCWKPTPNDLTALYIMSAIWGVGYGVWYPMMYAFYSVVFQKDMESAFSNFHLWYTGGSMMAYAWSYGLCVRTKIYLMIGIVSVGVICYMAIEVHMFIVARREKHDTSHPSSVPKSKDCAIRKASLPDTLSLEALKEMNAAAENEQYSVDRKH